MKPLLVTLVVIVVGTGHGGPANAQGFQGGIRGSVRDADGVLPGANVELTEEATGLPRRTLSNDRGEYVFANVVPGTYRVRASAAGFKVHEHPGIRIGTQTFLTIDLTLELGDVAERVTVEGGASLIETSNASFGTLLDRATLHAVPSAGRNVFFMSTLTPTAIASGDAQFVRQQDQSNSSLISLGGGPRRNSAYVLDGVPIVDILNRATFIPSLEAVEEMRVQVSAYDAEIGRTAGGVFNAIARSGSNAWHGTGLYQNRPSWAQGRLFFARKNDIANPDTYYHLYGGSVGGPLVRNRTYFWGSTEGYRTNTTRNTVLVLPTEAERRGDFSQSGVSIFDPLTTRPDPNNPTQFTRDPFPDNQIPAARLNPVAMALLKYLPMPTHGKSRPAVAGIVDAADQVTGKVTQRWHDRVTTSGLYAWYGSTEPDARFYGGPLFQNPADPGDGALVRRVHLLALNTLWTPGSQTAVALRYGFNSFLDDNRPTPFDPAELGFDPRFLASVPLRKFPNISATDYGRDGALFGDRTHDRAIYSSHSVNASLSRLTGRHTLKFGGEHRRTAVRFHNLGGVGGYSFGRPFTFGPNPNAPAPGTGDAFASFLLGYPSGGNIAVSSPIDIYLDYWAGFAQDDFRITPKLTLNAGVRYEFEDGLRERENRMVVGWAFDTPFPIQIQSMRPDGVPFALTGGLVYAGVDGAATHQGDPNPAQFAPRVGLAYAIDERTALRGGYGLFWAPSQGIGASESGSGTPGFNQTTNYLATVESPFIPCATCSLTNPFPAGIQQPRGNSLGPLTGVGGPIHFVDPRARMAHLHRYSIDLQRELPYQLRLGVSYIAARGENLTTGVGGPSLNINQLDSRHLALGTALQESVPNPFFGTPLAVGILSGAAIPRGQLLRPYPQFDGVYISRPAVAKSRYHALIFAGDRRLSDGWGVQASYTWSRLTDSQFAEGNFFAGGSGILNNYDVAAEYGRSVLDTPHHVNVVATIELPFGLALTAVGSYQTGFPVSVSQSPNNSNLLGSGQRPNIVAGADPRLRVDLEDGYDPSCGCIRWLNPSAWSQAAAFSFGNAPRADARVRTPARRQLDLGIQKSHRIAAKTFSLRAEVINLFDVADLRGPNVAFGDASFGQIREAAGFPRLLQIVARVTW